VLNHHQHYNLTTTSSKLTGQPSQEHDSPHPHEPVEAHPQPLMMYSSVGKVG